MARTYLTVLGLALACLAVSQAARLPTGDFFDENIEEMIMQMQTLGRHSSGGGGTSMDDKVYMAVRYRVPPSEFDRFIDQWQKLEDCVKNDKDIDVIAFDLDKHITDNIFFIQYSEWDSMRDLMGHSQKGYARDFMKFTAKHDIKWELMPLKNVTGESEKGRAFYHSVNRRHMQEELTHVEVLYHVPAMHHSDFMDTWTDTAKQTWKEDSNHVYALRKVATDNTRFVAYGTWETYEDFMCHFHSKHVQRLKDFVADKDIEWFMTPVRKMGRSEH